jgi:hypothetical protein
MQDHHRQTFEENLKALIGHTRELISGVDVLDILITVVQNYARTLGESESTLVKQIMGVEVGWERTPLAQQLEKALGMSWFEIRRKSLDLDLIDVVHTLEDGGTDLSDEAAIKAWFTPELMSNYPERFVDAVIVRARAYIDESMLETKLAVSGLSAVPTDIPTGKLRA